MKVCIPLVGLLSVLASLVMLASSAAAQQSASGRRLLPVDEAARDADLFLLRARLLQAAQERDTAFVYGILAPDIQNSFGGDGGTAEFRENWRVGDADSELWPILTEVLSLGGAFTGDTMFVAPYTFARFPPGLDGFENVVIVGARVRARELPSANAPVVGQLDYDIVEVRDPDPGEPAAAEGWTAVILPNGRKGWVASRYVRSPIDYRAGFVKRHGRWLLRWLSAGD